MNDAVEEEDSLLGTSALRGILLLGGVATISYFAWKYWNKIRTLESSAPKREAVVRVPISLPLPQEKKKK